MLEEKIKGLQSGLHPRYVMTQLLSNNLFLDPDETKQRLNYAEFGFLGGESCWKGIREAMQRCYPDTFQAVEFFEFRNSLQNRP